MEQEADHEDPRKKIQFSVPSSVPSQLDPRQVEMIRRRRPTPATLFRLTDPPSPEEDGTSHQRVLRDNTALKAKLVHMTSYQPPSLKGEETAVGFWIILDYRMDTQLQFGQPRTCACSYNTSVHTRKKLNRSPEPKRTPTEAVQRMAQAHFASLDMTSVDGEDSFSGEEERQQPVKEMQGTTTATDERDENSSTSLRHHNDNEEAHEEVEEKGE